MLKIMRILSLPGQLRSYDRGDLRADAVAGLTTAVMLIPQAMAYAMLAGLSPIVGLYASTVPVVLYALFGSSRQLAVGPVAVLSLMTAASVGVLAEAGSPQYLIYAMLLALMVGAAQLLMGLFRLGIITNFLSHPVLSGFTSAAALIIGYSQLDNLVGQDFHLLTAVIGVGSLVILLTLRVLKPGFPGMFLLVLGSTVAVWALGLDERGVKVVGDVPAGLPEFGAVSLSFEAMEMLLPAALVIALVGFMESYAVAKKIAARHGEEGNLDPNRELIGLGAANMGGSFFGGYPVAGGFSRSAVADQAGARSNLAGLFTAAVVVATLLFFTDLFYFLPRPVLAAIIVTAIVGLIDVKTVRHLWKIKRDGLVILGLTFATTLLVGIEEGLAAGIGASLLWFIIGTTRPHAAVLGRLPGTTSYRNIDRHPEARVIPGVLILRIDSQFYFGNVSFLQDTLRKLEERMEPPLRAVVIDASSINRLDSSAELALHKILEDYKQRDIGLYFAKVKGPVMDVMRASHFFEDLGNEHFTHRVHQAVEAACRSCLRAEDPEALECDCDIAPSIH